MPRPATSLPSGVTWRTHLSLLLLSLVCIFSRIDRQLIAVGEARGVAPSISLISDLYPRKSRFVTGASRRGIGAAAARPEDQRESRESQLTKAFTRPSVPCPASPCPRSSCG